MSKESFEEKLIRRAAQNREGFQGRYVTLLQNLKGLTENQIETICPHTTDREVYDKLIQVVEEASAQNLAQAELKQKIIELGEVAMVIARKIPSLGTLLL